MKLALYNKEGRLVTVFEGIMNPKLESNTLLFDQGSISNLTEKHILLEDEIEVPNVITDEVISLDNKHELESVLSHEEENIHLKKSVKLMQAALDDIILGGGF